MDILNPLNQNDEIKKIKKYQYPIDYDIYLKKQLIWLLIIEFVLYYNINSL